MATTTITFEVDTDSMGHVTDAHIAQLWHIAQANPAPFGDRNACEFAEAVGREIVRRWLACTPPELWTHQGRHVGRAMLWRCPAMNYPKPRAASRPRNKSSEALPAYGMACSVLSFREGLAARELGTIDRAMAIIGRTLRTPPAAMLDPEAVKDYMRLALGGETVERFGVLYLDSQNRAVAFEIVFNGTLTQTSVHPREIVRAALLHGAAAVILAHNHPSGSVKPSRADEALTQTLKATLSLVDVRVLDHVIVGGSDTLSMAERGLL